jgi:hypothetical protein
MIETQKFKSRFTDDLVEVVRFKGSSHLIDIMDWIIDSGSRAQGDIRPDGELDLMVHERGIGLVKVKRGDYITKSSDSGFEVHSPLTFTQMYERVSPVLKIIKKPVVLEAMYFDGGVENEAEIKKWLAESDYCVGLYKHNIPGTTRTYYRISMSNDRVIDIALNNWIVKTEDADILSLTDAEMIKEYQRAE